MRRRAVCVNDGFRHSVIPVFWEVEPSRAALLRRASMVFLQGGDLCGLAERLSSVRRLLAAKTWLMLHLDLLGGLTSDEAGVRYLANLDGIDGIITVRAHLVAVARKLGLASILLLFLQDGRSVERGLHLIEQCRPDAVELVPGIAALETADQFRRLPMSWIAGGLIRRPDLVRALLDNGCRAVSSSDPAIWELNKSSTEA